MAQAVAVGFSGEFPLPLFMALADSQDEAYREYQRYVAHRRLDGAARAFGETIL